MSILRKNRIVIALCVLLTLVVSSSPILAYLPDPDNAALLYYQAFLLYRQPDDSTSDLLKDFSQSKIEPNEKITKYIERNHNTIELAIAASEIPGCNWGMRYSEGFLVLLPHLSQVRNLSRLIIVDARILAAKGDYQQAIERCLIVHKMCLHIGGETIISFLLSRSISRLADDCLQDILSDMPPDVETLIWFKNQLVTMPRAFSLKAALSTEKQIALHSIHVENVEQLFPAINDSLNIIDDEQREKLMLALIAALNTNRKNMEKLLQALVSDADRETALEQLRQLGAEELLESNRDYYSSYMADLQGILDTPMSYVDTYTELKKLSEMSKRQAMENPAALLTAVISPQLFKIYGHDISVRSRANAIKTGLDIYIMNAKTGRMPDKLPAGLPKDLFSGKDFQYEKTKTGFILCCQGKNLDKDQIHQYEFKVSK
jgi:hypothetical protein